MCLAKAFLGSGERKELLMEEIASMRVEDGKLRLMTLFGEEREVEARVQEIDFMSGSIVLDDAKTG